MGSDGTPGVEEADVEPAKREVSAEETAYAGNLATNERVETVMEASAGDELQLRTLQGVVAQIRYEAAERLPRRVETA